MVSRYVTVLSDGDAKTYNHLVDLNIYGDNCPVTKEECVNHVRKRLGTALRKVAGEGRKVLSLVERGTAS